MMISSRDELSGARPIPAVDIEHLRVIRGKRPVLHDLSVRIAPGTITGLLGPSGCGKTTLMRCIVGTQVITGGQVTVLGDAAGSAALRRRVGYMPQQATIYDDLRVIDNVRYFASLAGVDASAADDAVDSVDLQRHRGDYCANLSGGQRARVSLAVRWSAGRTCWCSTNRRSAWTRCCGPSSGTSSRRWPGAAPRCWCPAMSWTRPTIAATCC